MILKAVSAQAKSKADAAERLGYAKREEGVIR
jgi:hypothetical protein